MQLDAWLTLGLIVALLALLIWDRFRTWGVQTRLIPGLLHQVHLKRSDPVLHAESLDPTLILHGIYVDMQ